MVGAMEKSALVLDDRKSHLLRIKKRLENEGYRVTAAANLKEAKNAVISAKKSGSDFDLIVSDFDLGTKLWQKHRWLDGYRFAVWCKNLGVKSRIVLHSTSFEPSRKMVAFLHRPIIRSAKSRGITVQGKSILMPSQHPKPRG